MKGITITIHQPEHLPWLGFFHKINMAEKTVILDNVQFRKNYFQNRNKVRTSNGWTWITVPVHAKSTTLINEVRIAADARWKKKWWNTVHLSYAKAPYFNDYSEIIHSIIEHDWKMLSDLNFELIKAIKDMLGIKTEFVKAAELNATGKGSSLILDICRKVGAATYIAGISGKDYLVEEDFKKENVNIKYQEFHHPIYKQLYEPFIPCMSTIDLLFNYGDKSLNIINGIGVPVMEELFL